MKPPGPWVRLAHDLYRNPKILTLVHQRQHRAVAVYACALAWSGDNRQDGYIPAFALTQIHATPGDAQHLCQVGLWLAADDSGWWIHDWHLWQDTNDSRQARTERMRSLANLRHHGHPNGRYPNPPPPDALRNA